MARQVGLAQRDQRSEVIFLDEPTAGWTIVSRQVKDLILDLKKGKTVFMSSHLLADIEDVRPGKDHAPGRAARDGSLRRFRPDKTQITVSGLAEGKRLEVAQAVEAAGATVDAITEPHSTLEDLFLRVIGKRKEEN